MLPQIFVKGNLNTDFEGTVKIFIVSPQLSGKATVKSPNKYENVLLILKRSPEKVP